VNQWNNEYFESYQRKNLLGLQKGERPFLYSFWMRKIKELIPKQSNVLEVGCGCGYFLKWLETRHNTVGIDISPEALKIARKMTKRAKLLNASAEKLPFGGNFFSVVIAFDVIEHLVNPEKFFKETYRILLPNGLLILSTPNPDSFGCRIKPQRPERKELSYGQQQMEWHGWRDDTHINIKSMNEWRQTLKNNRFIILKDGTDTLWDIPYFKYIPVVVQKILFMSTHWILTWIFGFFPWKYGENYVCIAQKMK
jgi:2-polyprenyl-3-methyl-5-hydroxy-6-metoxy-1,4-benzoquinol methylase